jgi:curved DNA-binding protein CbpA
LGFAPRPAKKKQDNDPRWRTSGAADPMKEARDILGLHNEFSAADLKARHRELMKRVHTDVGGTDWLSQRVNWAHDILKNAAAR